MTAEGSIPHRSYISLRDVLSADEELRHEYEQTKRRLAELYCDDELTYCKFKRPCIRKIFLKDGWTAEEVDVAEENSRRDWPAPTPADFYERDELFQLHGEDEQVGRFLDLTTESRGGETKGLE